MTPKIHEKAGKNGEQVSEMVTRQKQITCDVHLWNSYKTEPGHDRINASKTPPPPLKF